jgi:peptide/nickel transport system substrate-binding protein
VFYGLRLDGVLPDELGPEQRRSIRQADVAAVSQAGQVAAVDTIGGTPSAGLVSPSLLGADAGTRLVEADAERLPGVIADTPLAAGALVLPVAYTDPAQQRVAEAIAAELTAQGLPSAPELVTADMQTQAIAAQAPGLSSLGWVAPTASVDGALAPLIGSTSPMNVGGFSDPEIDRLLTQAAVTGDDEQRWALYAEAHGLAALEARLVPVVTVAHRLVLTPPLQDLPVRPDGSIALG